jgi:hypothetical protein
MLLSQHRRLTAACGILLVLGVVLLNAHEALPEHHHHNGTTDVCIASLSIAVLAIFAFRPKRAVWRPGRRFVRLVLRPASRAPRRRPSARSRAGPARPLVLRI